jgi:aspartyl-tRNA(Asn)/glutamyl-tRNA(Gln) amidotransferase subunit C
MDEASVRHVAQLARLSFSDDEIRALTGELARIDETIRALAKADVRHIEPTVHPLDLLNAWREDKVKPSFSRETAVSGAPAQEEAFFRVPPVIE